MLVQGIRKGVHLPPLRNVGWTPDDNERKAIQHAPKLTTHHRQVNWASWSAADLVTHHRVLGSLWCLALHTSGAVKRLIVEDVEIIPYPDHVVEYLRRRNSQPEDQDNSGDEHDSVVWFWKPEPTKGQNHGGHGPLHQLRIPFFPDGDGKAVIIPAVKGGCIRIKQIKAEGETAKPAATVLDSFGNNEPSFLDDIGATAAFDIISVPFRFVIETFDI
jgi:methionyl-tRNA formyltransferase